MVRRSAAIPGRSNRLRRWVLVFVHCAANMRVSVFICLHRLERNTMSRDEAERDLRRIWEPDGVWRAFINQR